MSKTPLATCLIGNGTVTTPRDMVRALETLESLDFTQTVDDKVMAEGRATLVKLMADGDSSTILVNGCLFLNVSSFRYLTFATDPATSVCVFTLVGDGMTLRLRPRADSEPREAEPLAIRLMEQSEFDPESFVALEDEDDEE